MSAKTTGEVCSGGNRDQSDPCVNPPFRPAEFQNADERLSPPKTLTAGITLRAALWSWVVSVAILLVFVFVTIPQQKRIFQENLESKAKGIAVSLRDVAAGAAVNEDFSSVVDHCKELLHGDPALEYLVVTKNDGFSLINERNGWRSEPKSSEAWHPANRVTTSGIGVMPMFNRRVFHYSQPFDYSGIEWGWIHVGISLKSYDQNVTDVYRRTGILALVCVVLSLVASGFYARQLVRPVLQLRNVVLRVAKGDLTARAEIHRNDEVGTLASSVNSMTNALLRRDRILESVRFAAQQFLGKGDWNQVIIRILEKLSLAAETSSACVVINRDCREGCCTGETLHQWLDPRLLSAGRNMPMKKIVYEVEGLSRWKELLEKREILGGIAHDMPASEQAFLLRHCICSFILIPLHVDEKWWGFVGFFDSFQNKAWSDGERDSLRAAADMLSSAIARQKVRDALVEAKETLEQRVLERTRQLQEQVLAKDRANAQLAEAQHKLIEISRQAGMAEVATGVLHNVGNVLNSVNVSVNVLSEKLRNSQLTHLRRACSMLESRRDTIGEYLTQDPKGRRIPELISLLTVALEDEKTAFSNELLSLLRNIEHIKEIVAMQQSYARVAGVVEDLAPAELADDALRMNEAGLARHDITVRREFAQTPFVRVDKHKVLQILVNLFRNAKYALSASSAEKKVLSIGIALAGERGVQIAVTDNGVGIAPENLTRIFAHGFTTKKDGHGFGLHSGALAAKEMGGSLRAFSNGLGTGATFILELPIAGKTVQANMASAELEGFSQ